jgi:hypothetical protein
MHATQASDDMLVAELCLLATALATARCAAAAAAAGLTWRFACVYLHHCADGCLQIVALRLLRVEDLHRVQPAWHLTAAQPAADRHNISLASSRVKQAGLYSKGRGKRNKRMLQAQACISAAISSIACKPIRPTSLDLALVRPASDAQILDVPLWLLSPGHTRASSMHT